MCLRRTSGVLILSFFVAGAVQAGGLEDWIQSFARSEFQFGRRESNVPFEPMAWVTAKGYGSSSFRLFGSAEAAGEYEHQTLSQAALVPLLASPRDALVLGEWVGLTRFQVDGSAIDDFDVLSVGVPLGWARQASPDWQVAAFIAPLAHKASTGGADWYWEGMGGIFGRHEQSDRLDWIVGFYADVSRDDKFYVPYVGATLGLNERWTLSVVMPWPAVLYAPTVDTLWRIGVSPSGASWAIKPGAQEVAVDLDSWDLGVSVEHRLAGPVWARLEAGVGGFRGLSFKGGHWEAPNSDLGSGGFVGIGLTFRPAIAAR